MLDLCRTRVIRVVLYLGEQFPDAFVLVLLLLTFFAPFLGFTFCEGYS